MKITGSVTENGDSGLRLEDLFIWCDTCNEEIKLPVYYSLSFSNGVKPNSQAVSIGLVGQSVTCPICSTQYSYKKVYLLWPE